MPHSNKCLKWVGFGFIYSLTCLYCASIQGRFKYYYLLMTIGYCMKGYQ